MTAADAPRRSDTSNDRLVADWIRLWNGDLAAAPSILADDLKLHVARVDGTSDDHGPEALTSWITVMRTVMSDLRFDIEVGPFVDGDAVVLRWIATGRYAAGFPGATSPVGTRVHFTGTDILRITDRRIAEYWVNADMHVLLAQLGVLPS